MTSPGPIVAIVGPTASGKSSLADALAMRLGGAVISVDAMQVYRGMDIGTAKTPPAGREAPLLMVDVADVREDYSVQRFQSEARACVDVLLSQGQVPILCGGTGLYLDAVIDEVSFPQGRRGSGTRLRWERMAEAEGAEALHRELAMRDPKSAELVHPHNMRRVVRALEMLDEGVSYARQHEGLRQRTPHYLTQLYAMMLPRAVLYERIDARVDRMFSQGLVQEVESLRAQGLTEGMTAGQAIGYKEVLAALRGDCSLDEARKLIKRRTRHYAKRQLSWLRRDGRARPLDATLPPDELVGQVLSGIQTSRDACRRRS